MIYKVVTLKKQVILMEIMTLNLYSKIIYDQQYNHEFRNKHLSVIFLMLLDKIFTCFINYLTNVIL